MLNKLPITLLLLLSIVLGACSSKEHLLLPEADLSIGIVPFSQPGGTTDLMAGYISDTTPRIDARVFPLLDNDFADLLADMTDRRYIGLDKAAMCIQKNPKNKNAAAFEYWVSIGNCMGVDILIVPQVLHWQERVGAELGAEKPASIAIDFFLLNVKSGELIARSRYDEKQRPLLENLMDINKFIERKGRWVSAATLAQEGMYKAIKEFGL